jgi:hypothetical protein
MVIWIGSDSGAEFSLDRKVRPQPGEQGKAEHIREAIGKKPRCCICNTVISPGRIVIEERPTGEDGSI